jgi:putative ABC transport system permease protein
MRNVFGQTAPDFALDNFQTMQQVVDSSNFSRRLGLYLTGAFAGMAVLMVIAGLYGVLAQLVSYRRREIESVWRWARRAREFCACFSVRD